MDRTVSAALLLPKHLLTTAAVFLLLGGGGGLLVGAVGAQADSEPFANVMLPEPHEGDHAVYHLEKAALSAEDVRRGFPEDRDLSVAFRMGPPSVQYDSQFQPHWASAIDWSMRQHRAGRERDDNGTTYVDVRDGSEIASGTTRVVQDPSRTSPSPLPGTSTSTGEVTWWSLSFVSGSQLPCGLLGPTQGRTLVASSRIVRVEPDCPGMEDPNAHWVAVRPGADGHSVEVDHYRTNPADTPRAGEAPDWRALYRDDLPYAVAIEDVDGGNVGAPGDRLVLSGFDRGSSPLASAPGFLPALPSLVDVPLKPWLLDDTGVDHPFPLSAAYAHVLADPQHTGLRDFMAAHRNAYVGWARYAEFDVDGTHQHRWSFNVTDGVASHSEMVSMDIGPSSGLVPGLPPTQPAATTYSYQTGDQAPYPLTPVKPEALPATLPSVASLLAVWDVAGLQQARQPQSNRSWDFVIGTDPQTGNLSVVLSAGQTYYRRISQPGYPLIDNRDDVWWVNSLRWIDGRLIDAEASEQAYATRTDSPLSSPASPANGGAAAAAFQASPAPRWSWPTTVQAVVIVSGAFLGTLLYFLWPAFKGGALGLFSRVQPDQALDHPVRAQIVAAVNQQPGIHQQELVRLVGKGNGAAEHHLDKLVAAGILTRQRSAGYTCYFRAGQVDRRAMAWAHLLKSPVARAVMRAAQEAPGTSLAAVARQLDVSVPTVHYHVKRLQKAGLVAWNEGLYPTPVAGEAAAA